jgi:hypothetical protein
MQITGTLQIRATATEAPGETLLLARIDEETARVQALGDEGLEALCPLLNAMDTGEVARKIVRFVVASANPGAVLGRVYTREPDGFADFCLQLAAYRAYMARITDGDAPVRAAEAAERARRDWLARAVRTHQIVDEEPAPDAPDVDTSGLDMDYERIDVYDAEGEIDPRAVRAEVDRLLRRMNVPPERIELQVLPDDLP